ncbi:hypothetical protein HRR83_004297 [Exophiala dermatitidis]|uniref:Uncharacterized protein n=1 Tax=Exophiala dermatitidis TaxID=5970 RepID=A0AAN6EUH7_EXODE|nr:hypothetical protein HRR73_006240 [Exophiala dermatitidis]KAJ4521398.1 hypothetical protein HRR74_003221 [Exophiala dermatitidis]KAJ4542072.1 hypothetical protein HRR77_005957 [Exophiala dermatitidis]KAJ4544837.1 hypothetical protein HRR76_002874 [Exophiala dermatitidis]KAJ4565312.1 hypothetical protein HRR79_005575 [Exophiala dermatitidis]
MLFSPGNPGTSASEGSSPSSKATPVEQTAAETNSCRFDPPGKAPGSWFVNVITATKRPCLDLMFRAATSLSPFFSVRCMAPPPPLDQSDMGSQPRLSSKHHRLSDRQFQRYPCCCNNVHSTTTLEMSSFCSCLGGSRRQALAL